MSARDHLHSIGVMTGNSLDGVDVVLTRFHRSGNIEDLESHGKPTPKALRDNLIQLREAINKADGDMHKAESELSKFSEIETDYVQFVAEAIKELIEKVENCKSLNISKEGIDVIGFHGQTCAHLPPSIASLQNNSVYTCQLGDGQKLADLTGITVIYDFRSDDVMNGGEGAPLAPMHHEHLAQKAKQDGHFPLAFLNAGNTGNISVISNDTKTGAPLVIGWDTGPFNNFPDKLVQDELDEDCDLDGQHGSKGRINKDLLKLMFDRAVITSEGENFLLMPPPKSSDPQWYKNLPELFGKAELNDTKIEFRDRLRTAEYFSAYIYVYNLSHIQDSTQFPMHFALCGGGWKNPLAKSDFEALLNNQLEDRPILEEHLEVFKRIHSRFKGQKPHIDWSDQFGFDGGAMEARIFADAAVCRVKGEPFTNKSITGTKSDTVCGIIRFPGSDRNKASTPLKTWLESYDSLHLTTDKPDLFDNRWSRASKGWQNLLAKC